MSAASSAQWVFRTTTLHPALWAPYRLTAYPNGFAGAAGGPDYPPVWEPSAMVIGRRNGRATCCYAPLGDAATLDDALEACWAHYASLH